MSRNILSQYVYISKYARYLHDEGRRERWPETVKRYFDFFQVHLKNVCGYDLSDDRSYLESAILNYRVMPSMRCLMTAGPALEKENAAGFNCQFLVIDNPKAFSELLYL